jgi:hypothetical protein
LQFHRKTSPKLFVLQHAKAKLIEQIDSDATRKELKEKQCFDKGSHAINDWLKELSEFYAVNLGFNSSASLAALRDF